MDKVVAVENLSIEQIKARVVEINKECENYLPDDLSQWAIDELVEIIAELMKRVLN